MSIRFAESEDRDDHAVLLSPWPESLLAFQRMWAPLAERTHLVAIDLPGFGHSERSDALLSPRAMGEFVIHVADAFGLENPHAVGPDVGTGALLFAAALHAEFLHERLPKSKLDIIDAGHFNWEEAPDEYAALVTSWWSGGYANTGTEAGR